MDRVCVRYFKSELFFAKLIFKWQFVSNSGNFVSDAVGGSGVPGIYTLPDKPEGQGLFIPNNIRDLLNNLPTGSITGSVIPQYPGSKPIRVIVNPPSPSDQSCTFIIVLAGTTTFEGKLNTH